MAPDLQSRLADYLSLRNDVVFSYLFGSVASGRATADSDIDIALYLRDGAATTLPDVEEPGAIFDAEQDIWADVERICRTQVDLVILNRAPAAIAAGVMLTGVLLNSTDDRVRTDFFLAVTTLAEEEREFVEDFVRIKDRSRSLSEIDRSRLVRIIDFLEDELCDAPRFSAMDIERYSTDRDFRRSVERWVEYLVNASIDAAKIVLASERRPVPQTYRESVEMLSTVEGFRDRAAVARRLAENTRIRNMLAHEYLDLRYTQVGAVVDGAAETYGALVEALRGWMKR
jgi:uncharacterized protein YutE (UPF0331/DUF86 family)/predicted nucleotidyltransferase